MSLEDAMLKLAASMDRYAGVLENISNSNPTQIAVATGGTASADAGKPAGRKGKGGAAAAADTAADAGAGSEPDPFAEEEEAGNEEVELTAEVIRGLVMKVKDKNKDHALALLKKVGAETVSKIDPKMYPKVVELAGKVGVTL